MPKIFEELKRRKVIGTITGYLLIGWIVMQVLEVMVPALRLPDSVSTVAAYVLLFLFPFVVLFSWLFDVTPKGIRLDHKESQTSEHRYSRSTRRKLDLVILGGFIAALSLFVYTNFIQSKPETPLNDNAIVTEQVATIEPQPSALENLTPQTNAIAVLPFRVRSTDKNNQYFADGLTDEIIMALSAAPDLLVMARGSSFVFRNEATSIAEVATALNVSHILEGSARIEGVRTRISVRLIQTADQSIIWSQVYDRDLEDAWSVQTDIASNVVSSLGIILDEVQMGLLQTTGVQDVDAFMSYQRGLELYAQAHGDAPLLPTLVEANAAFDKVIAINKNFTSAYLKKVDYFAHILMDQLPDETVDPNAALSEISSAMMQAFDAERDAEQKNMTLANHIFLSDDWSLLSETVDVALSGAEGCVTDLWLSDVAAVFGKAQMALDWNLRRLACNRLNPSISTFAAFNALMLGDTVRARKILREQEEISGGRNVDSALYIQTLLSEGQRTKAESEFNDLLESGSLLAVQLYSALNNREEASWHLTEFLKSNPPIWMQLPALAVAGETGAANDLAAKIDQTVLGHATLAAATSLCVCGAPFDIRQTPNFEMQMDRAGFSWPPASPIEWPLMQRQQPYGQ